MANAGCINAIGFDGCFIQTLQNLDSACIGVGVQFTAPNPLDDKRFDYIKYTDKCGNTCCLTGENEILIYATNGTIKNLTLTNDDANEVVNVKRNDIFGSNWKKTVVRYKTGGYPTSITDGTLAVEELVQNQYSSSGYNVSGLSDATTYYFSVFAVAQDDTIIVVQTNSITTDFEWKPTSDTILFVPMKTDFSDHSSLNIAITNHNSVSLASNVGGATIPVGNFGNGSSSRYLSLNNSVNMQGTYTILCRGYFNAYSSQYGSYIFVQGTNSDNKGLHVGMGTTAENRGLLMAFYGNDLDTNQRPTTSTRHHFAFTYNGNGLKSIYQDGTLKTSGSGSKFTGTLFTATIGARPRQTDARINGYLSNLIIEKRVRTLAEIQAYYNKMKNRYGIS